MNAGEKNQLLETIGATAEVLGQQLSPAALVLMMADLDGYEFSATMQALARVRRECSRLTIAAIIERVHAADGRPGVEEAWAMLPKGEDATVVWTEEMAKASAVTRDMISSGDMVGARMAFKEVYQKLCQESRDRAVPVTWSVSLGWDKGSRESAIKEAVSAGRITADQAMIYLPADIDTGKLLASAPELVKGELHRLRSEIEGPLRGLVL